MSEELKQEGLSLFRRRLYDDAVVKFNAAAAVYEEQGDGGSRLEMFNNIGVIRRLQHDWDNALSILNEAEQGFSTLGDPIRHAQVLANVGDVYADRGDREGATRYYGQSAALFAGNAGSQEERAMHSQVLRALSLLHLRQRQWLAAMNLMEQSLTARLRLDPFNWLFRALLRLVLRLSGTK
jgi:tetratricopeptide (TPR) repeat protein